jgi:hypothetical protein
MYFMIAWVNATLMITKYDKNQIAKSYEFIEVVLGEKVA